MRPGSARLELTKNTKIRDSQSLDKSRRFWDCVFSKPSKCARNKNLKFRKVNNFGTQNSGSYSAGILQSAIERGVVAT